MFEVIKLVLSASVVELRQRQRDNNIQALRGKPAQQHMMHSYSVMRALLPLNIAGGEGIRGNQVERVFLFTGCVIKRFTVAKCS